MTPRFVPRYPPSAGPPARRPAAEPSGHPARLARPGLEVFIRQLRRWYGLGSGQPVLVSWAEYDALVRAGIDPRWLRAADPARDQARSVQRLRRALAFASLLAAVGWCVVLVLLVAEWQAR